MTPRSLSVDLVLELTAPHCARTLTRAALQQWRVRDDRRVGLRHRPAAPARRRETDEGGRGMLLIGLLSADWGVEPRERGKRVYALLALQRERCA